MREPLRSGPGAARGSALLCALALSAFGASVAAHGLDANRVELVLHGDTVEAVATPPSGFVREADANGDGLLTLAEVGAHREAIRSALVAALHVTDEGGREGALERSDVSVPRGHDATEDAQGRDYLRLTVKLRWPRAPRAVRLRCAFAGEHPLSVYATRAESSTPGMLTLVGEPEWASLASPTAELTLLRAPGSAEPTRVTAATPTPTSAAGASGLSLTEWFFIALMAGLWLTVAHRRGKLLDQRAMDARGGSR